MISSDLMKRRRRAKSPKERTRARSQRENKLPSLSSLPLTAVLPLPSPDYVAYLYSILLTINGANSCAPKRLIPVEYFFTYFYFIQINIIIEIVIENNLGIE
ncbi:hypothetical protein PUN28_006649 [Cardiocondyla obscurior]|uniref:Uncharacterized protein n=1 Tax=Cardiocondyla obscurior TaxID=286306 RepID=A0AAW2GBB6_9HYME